MKNGEQNATGWRPGFGISVLTLLLLVASATTCGGLDHAVQAPMPGSTAEPPPLLGGETREIELFDSRSAPSDECRSKETILDQLSSALYEAGCSKLSNDKGRYRCDTVELVFIFGELPDGASFSLALQTMGDASGILTKLYSMPEAQDLRDCGVRFLNDNGGGAAPIEAYSYQQGEPCWDKNDCDAYCSNADDYLQKVIDSAEEAGCESASENQGVRITCNQVGLNTGCTHTLRGEVRVLFQTENGGDQIGRRAFSITYQGHATEACFSGVFRTRENEEPAFGRGLPRFMSDLRDVCK